MAVSKKDKGSIRTTITLSKEVHEWVVSVANKMGIPYSTCITILINEAKATRENRIEMADMIKAMANQDYSKVQEDMKKFQKQLEDEIKDVDFKEVDSDSDAVN